MKIPVFGIPVLNREDLLLCCLESIDYPVGILHIINNGDDPGVARALAWIRSGQFRTSRWIDRIVIEEFNNLGCSRSWNRIIRNNPGPWLLCNNDVRIGSGALGEMISHLDSYPDIIYGFEARLGYCFFLMTPRGATKIGLFDENIWPAYYEDVDHGHRVRMTGAKHVEIRTRSLHGDEDGPSCTIRKDARLAQIVDTAIKANKQYVLKKWGAIPPDKACWRIPFNGKNPKLLSTANTDYRGSSHAPDRPGIPRAEPSRDRDYREERSGSRVV